MDETTDRGAQSEATTGKQSFLSLSASPIASLGDDRMGRRTFSEALAAEVLSAPAAQGYVMGLTGPWGSGKTSILNMTVDVLGAEALVVQFNPWMFSGTESLVASFFEEIGKQLEHRESKLKGIASRFADYGHLLSPLASLVGAAAAVSGAADVLEKLSTGPSVFEQRQILREELADLKRRLIVIVDDVDRLRPQEVLDIVRLVSLVGDFPNTVYLLAFDRSRVEQCLGEGNGDRGRAYLEKIVQVTHDVPAPRQSDLTTIFVDGLEGLYDTMPRGPFDIEGWQNIYTFVVRPLLATPRNVRRLLDSLSMTMRLVDDEVAFADLVGIEAVRVLNPAMFAAIISVADSLSAQGASSQVGYLHGSNESESPIAPMSDVDRDLAKDIVRWLFPAALRYVENMNHGPEWELIWRNQRKIASSSVFRFYLERQLPAGIVPARTVDDALNSLTDGDGLQALFDTLSPSELIDLIERMNVTLEEIPFEVGSLENDPARVSLPVFLDLLPRLPEDTGMLTYTGSMVLMRASIRLIKRASDEGIRADLVRLVMGSVRSLSGRLILLMVTGHRDGIGVGLITPEVAGELEEQLRSEVMALSPIAFTDETRATRLADFVAETLEGKAYLTTLAEDDRVMLSLLVGSTGDVRARATGAAAVNVTKVLAWDQLTNLLTEELLKRRIAELVTLLAEDELELSDEEKGALELGADYATGHRPESRFDRMMRIQGDAVSVATAADASSASDPDMVDTLETDQVDNADEGGDVS